MEEVYYLYVCLPNQHTPLANEIQMNSKFFPFFKDCLGALDGTHIHTHVLSMDRTRHCNQKGEVSQNVCAATLFSIQFVYVLSGWEGSASDSCVFEVAHGTGFTISYESRPVQTIGT